MNAATLVRKLWNDDTVLRDEGMSDGDCIERLTDLLFLEMADEQVQPPHGQASIVHGAYPLHFGAMQGQAAFRAGLREKRVVAVASSWALFFRVPRSMQRTTPLCWRHGWRRS